MFYGGKTPLIPIDQLKAWGYQLIIIPSDLQRAAIAAMKETLDIIKKNGDSSAIQEKLISFNEREAIVKTQQYLSLDL